MSQPEKPMQFPEQPTGFDQQQAIELINHCTVAGRTVPNRTNFHDSYWLWDSGFVAAGLAYTDPERARAELINVLPSQHQNGMIPHVVMRPDLPLARLKHNLAWGNVGNPVQKRYKTSGITQPPVLATASRIVAEQTSDPIESDTFLRTMYDGLVRHHEWFLDQRDPNHDNVVSIIHPWESGMDNSPSMLVGIKPKPVEKAIGKLVNPFRNDVSEGLDASLRTTPENGIALASLIYRLRKDRYDSARVLGRDQPSYAVDSVLVNNVLLKSTKDLAWIANQIGNELPDRLQDYMADSKAVIDRFWDPVDKRFYDIDATSGEHIKIPTISNVLPLINHEELTEAQGASITGLLADETEFAAAYGVPTISRSSPAFHPDGYWSGPMWPWMNRYLFHGAKQAGETGLATKLRAAVLDSVGSHGAYEHYSPVTGQPGGAKEFSPTAASFIELSAVAVK